MIECGRCIYTDSPCVPSDYGRDEHNNCDHFKSVFEENEELKKQIEKLEKLVPKTCENCVGYGCHAICVDCDFKDKWEIK